MDYIPDKDLYKAVMFACRMIRDGKSAPLAMRIAANYYRVDQSDVNFYVSQRAGSRRRSSTKGRTYKYFAVACIVESGDGSYRSLQSVSVEKGISWDTVRRKFRDDDNKYDRTHDAGGVWSSIMFHELLREFDSRQEAEDWTSRNKIKIRDAVEYCEPLPGL